MPIRDNPARFEPVQVMADVWIGCGCKIMAGVTIGSRAVVAAGAVVAKDVDAGTIVGGISVKALKI